MKKLAGILTVCVCFTTTLFAQERLEGLLHSEEWRDRDQAISIIVKDFENYSNDDFIKQEVLRLLVLENERIKYLRENKLMSPEPGRGEYYINVLALVIKLDIPDSTEALLNSASLGNKVEDAIVKRLEEEGNEDAKVLRSLTMKFTSSNIFYKGNRSAYLSIVNKYLKKEPLLSEKKREIIRGIVFDGLSSENHFVQQYAIQSSKYFPEDQQIITELQRIAAADTHSRLKDGVKTFPLRDEARKVLQEIQKTQ